MIKDAILGNTNFLYRLQLNTTSINTDNKAYKPIVSNGFLVFLGDATLPTSSDTLVFEYIYIYEGKKGLSELENLKISTLLFFDGMTTKLFPKGCN